MSEPLQELSEQGLLAANRHLRRLMESHDEKGFDQFLHSDFLINAPNNFCGGRDQILRLSEGAALANENCQTRIERTSLTGNVGIVMGDEMVTPAEGSLLVSWFGTTPVRLRFTDVYLFEEGRWLLLARQGSVVREAQKFGG